MDFLADIPLQYIDRFVGIEDRPRRLPYRFARYQRAPWHLTNQGLACSDNPTPITWGTAFLYSCLTAGLIKHLKFPWASLIVPVPEEDGSRIMVTYERLYDVNIVGHIPRFHGGR